MTDKEFKQFKKFLCEELADMKLELDVLDEGLRYLVKLVREDMEATRSTLHRLEKTVNELARNTPSSPLPSLFPRMRN